MVISQRTLSQALHHAMVQPPSALLKKGFQNLKGADPTAEYVKKLAMECLLPVEEVNMWLDHLKAAGGGEL